MRSALPTLRSRRLALVAAAVVLGLTACGSDPDRQSADTVRDPATTVTTAETVTTAPVETIPAGGPPPIRIGDASGGVPTGPAAADSLVEGEPSADTKMVAAFMQFNLECTDVCTDADFPELSGPATAWSFPAQADAVTDERVTELAAILGVEGPVEVIEDELGGGKMIGAGDFSGPSFTVGVDAMQTWWFNAGDAAMSAPVCEMSSEAPPDTIGDPSKEEDQPREDCVPQPPTGVPSADEAEAATTDLMTRLGYDPSSYEFETYADEWGASVNAYLFLEGVRSNVSMYFSFGAEGVLSWAGGFLATPERGEDYPRIGVLAAVERLNAPNWLMGDLRAAGDLAVDTGAAESEEPPSEPVEPSTEPIEPVETLVADVPVEIDPMPCDPAADCIPTDMEPIVVTIRDPQPTLEQLWADDGTVWLLPGYTFSDDADGIYSVIAVEAAYLLSGDSEPTPEPTVDSVPLPDTVVPDTVAPETTVLEDTGTSASPEMELTGLVLEEAEKVAEQNGWVVRVVREDGVDLAATMDFRENRVNVAVVGGMVIEVLSIG